MKSLFTEKALNNILWHRREMRVLIVQDANGSTIMSRIFSKKKELIKFRNKAISENNNCFMIRVKPNQYHPYYLIK